MRFVRRQGQQRSHVIPTRPLQCKAALTQAEADARQLEHEAILAQIHDMQRAREQTVRLAEVKSLIATAPSWCQPSCW
jgi:hypothetical protein